MTATPTRVARADRVCYVHVGTHKTGTTSIQRFLALNHERFAAAGVVLPRSGCDNAPDYLSHHQLAYELTANPIFDRRFGGIDELAAELRASRAHTACVSSENLSLLWHQPLALQRVRDAVVGAGFTPRIICYLRPQASFLTSVYAQIVCHDDCRVPFDRYLDDVIAGGRYVWRGVGPSFDYARLVDAFADVFGAQALVVRRYRPAAGDQTLLREFTGIIAPSLAWNELARPAVRENGSLDFNTVLSRLTIAVPDLVKIRFTPLSVEDTLRVARRFGPGNAAIAARYGVRVPPCEMLDLAFALPVRRQPAKMRALAAARRALRSGRPVS